MDDTIKNLPWNQRWKTKLSAEELKYVNKIENCEKQIKQAEAQLFNAKQQYSDYKRKQFAEAIKEFPDKAFQTGNGFFNIFGGNRELTRLLLSKVDNPRFFQWELIRKLHDFGIFTFLDLVAKPREYYAQSDVLGEKDTLWIEEALNSRGLTLGMQFSATGLII